MIEVIIKVDEHSCIVDEKGIPILDDDKEPTKIWKAERSVYKKIGITIQLWEPKES